MIEDEATAHWNDKIFIAEIDQRINELETGKTKGYSWNKVKEQAAQTLKSAKVKKSCNLD
jgi:hypothetical protein